MDRLWDLHLLHMLDGPTSSLADEAIRVQK